MTIIVYLCSTTSSRGRRQPMIDVRWDLEFAYDIPIALSLLLSANPRTCASLIFEEAADIALVGDYEPGVGRLMQFLDRVPHPRCIVEGRCPALPRIANEQKSILRAGASRGFRDVGRVGQSLVEENQKLLAELADLEPQMAKAIAEIEERVSEERPPNFLARLSVHQPARRTRRTWFIDWAWVIGQTCSFSSRGSRSVEEFRVRVRATSAPPVVTGNPSSGTGDASPCGSRFPWP